MSGSASASTMLLSTRTSWPSTTSSIDFPCRCARSRTRRGSRLKTTSTGTTRSSRALWCRRLSPADNRSSVSRSQRSRSSKRSKSGSSSRRCSSGRRSANLRQRANSLRRSASRAPSVRPLSEIRSSPISSRKASTSSPRTRSRLAKSLGERVRHQWREDEELERALTVGDDGAVRDRARLAREPVDEVPGNVRIGLEMREDRIGLEPDREDAALELGELVVRQYGEQLVREVKAGDEAGPALASRRSPARAREGGAQETGQLRRRLVQPLLRDLRENSI